MSIDLSALLGGGDPDLGGALTSTTPSGDLLFQKPFGDSTKWRTDTGCVVVRVIFDPFLPWSKENLLASTTPNYIQDIRRALGEMLVPEKMAPTDPTLDELIFKKLSDTLPDKTFDRYLASHPDRQSRYVEILEEEVTREYEEDQAIITALRTRSFHFTYHLAIDKYPQDKAKDAHHHPATKGEKLGVLVFNIQGFPDTPITEERAGKVGVDMLQDQEGTTPPPSPKSEAKKKHEKPPLRRHRSSTLRKDQRELEDLLEKLEIDTDQIEKGHTEWVKKLPTTATVFFDQLGSWFSALLERKRSQLEKQQDKQSSSMLYR